MFSGLENFGDSVALLGRDSRPWSYTRLVTEADRWGASLSGRNLVLVLCRNVFPAVAGYVGFLRAGAAVLLLHESVSLPVLDDVIRRFCPSYVLAPSDRPVSGVCVAQRDGYSLHRLGPGPDLHPDLCLLLTTSGTTGNRSFVRLSAGNLVSNARSIVQYLGLGSGERAITTMPFSYSYGLSILHTHLLSGASVVLSEDSIITPAFWDSVRTFQVTTFGGVPFFYDTLRRLGPDSLELPHLRVLTQAGGRLSSRVADYFVGHCERLGMRFFTMYGQTEAAPRMAYVPWEQARARIGSMGLAVPGGAFSLVDENGQPVTDPGCPGELVYRGPNVSMGTAECAADLALGDRRRGVLPTGDMAVHDGDGFYTLVGRRSRFLKMSGYRISLDEVETLLREAGYETACTGQDDRMQVFMTGDASEDLVRRTITARTGIHAGGLCVRRIASLPRLESGKIDYPMLVAGQEA